MNQSYDTTDWDAEAKRVARAFGIIEACEFRCPAHKEKEKFFLLQNAPIPKALPLREINGGQGFAWYDESQRYFGVARFSQGVAVWMNWKGELTSVRHPHKSESADRRDTLRLSQTLFHLGLLTPEVEADLKVSVSQHQKLEWTLEFEAHHEL